MFHKILVANRGEIAVRIIRAAQQMGILTVAVYSKADETALHKELADEAICIGEAPSKLSYLNAQAILSAALYTGADAIHPGFGFLSEDAEFARLCEEVGIKFIGPTAQAISVMGDKAVAKQTMKEAGVPLVPGSAHEVTLEEAKQLAQSIGYPLLIKASAGGGGKGMRVVQHANQLESTYHAARNEAKAAFSHDGVYLEKYLSHPKHIEVQILGDKYGHIIHLGDRDCSIQRNHQKLLEEAPATLDEPLQTNIREAALKAAQAVNYENAGTVEFLVQDGECYFIEMNTRIQVEHPVTEMITRVDLIQWQIKIASGLPLTLTQEDIRYEGHAIEVRLNAENPAKNFLPSPGTLNFLHLPQGLGIRFDSALYQGYTIPPFYDSMIGKLIVHAETREAAIKKMQAALNEIILEGMDHNQAFMAKVVKHHAFVEGQFDTTFMQRFKEGLLSDGT